MNKINPLLPIYFYDDRNKYDYMLKADENILYNDGDIAIVMAMPTNPEYDAQEKIIFNLADGSVVNSEYDSWYATNDVQWALQKVESFRQRNS
jgi:hypothetical protein